MKDHGEDEVRGWENRPLGNRWTDVILLGQVWVIEHEGTIQGVGYLRPYEEDGAARAEVGALYLSPEALGKGLGRKLLELLIERARSAGATAITLDSSLTSHEFYKRMGFVDHGLMNVVEIGGSQVRGYPMILRLGPNPSEQ